MHQKEMIMVKTKILAAAAAVLVIGALGGCASTGEPAGIAGRHQHLRDAKQGPAASALATAEQAPKLLHDHREMK
jgi:hypothetical protein